VAAPGEPGRSVLAGELTRQILSSAKYRGLDEGLVRRVAAEAAQRVSGRAEAGRYARRKLHQAFGAFQAGSPARAVARAAADIAAGRAGLRGAALAAMRSHTSSAERIAWLEQFYAQVRAWCGVPASVADLACGLNPLAVPWMTLAPGAAYWACEIDADLVAALASVGEHLPVALTAVSRDLAVEPPPLRADVALLLKTVTTIEQQAAGAGGRVLAALDCAHVIVSLPRRSLSGRRGYADDPAAIVAAIAAGSRYRPRDEAVFGSELVCHLTP